MVLEARSADLASGASHLDSTHVSADYPWALVRMEPKEQEQPGGRPALPPSIRLTCPVRYACSLPFALAFKDSFGSCDKPIVRAGISPVNPLQLRRQDQLHLLSGVSSGPV